MNEFTQLGLAAPIIRALEGEGYTLPTLIQAQTIPAAIAGSDILGIAQTGTGKTAAFALPILHRLDANRRPTPRGGCRVLVLSPTRELASQIGESFRTYGQHLGVSVGIVFGGVGHRPQINTLTRGVDILVATPGRLLDHLGEGKVRLGNTEILVLDEADQMLDAGFLRPIQKIVSNLSHERQNLLFSATMPKEIVQFANKLLRNPIKVSVTPAASTVDRIDQQVICIETRKKKALLVELLGDQAMSQTLVFTRTKRGADKVTRHLAASGIEAAAIHGNKSQRQREAALDAFRSAKIKVLVATDIAARGIDVSGVSHVVNYDLPEVPEAYVHRIGRTARAGASGHAISLCDTDELNLLRDIERVTRQSIPRSDRRNDDNLETDKTGDGRSSNAKRRGPGGNTRNSTRPANGARKPKKTQSDVDGGKHRRPTRKAATTRVQNRSASPAAGDQGSSASKPALMTEPDKRPTSKPHNPRRRPTRRKVQTSKRQPEPVA